MKIVEKKIPLSFRVHENKKVLFRLANPKREKSKSYAIYEKAKFSANLKSAFINSYRKVDIDYDTTFNSRFKKANILIDIPQYLDKSKKSLYENLLSENKIFIKENKVSSEIIENQKYFENIISKL